MPEARRDLWPEDFTTTTVMPPVAILREQAELLARKTKGLVTGEVTSGAIEPDEYCPPLGVDIPFTPKFYHTLRLRVPALGNYRYELLTVVHGFDFYPLMVTFLPKRREFLADTEGRFLDVLQRLFAQEETVNILRSLVAQVQG